MFIVYLLRARYCPRLYDYKQVHTQNPCPARVHILAGEGGQWNILVNYRIYKKLKIAREKNQVRGCWGWRVEMGTVILNKAIRNRHWRWKLSKDPKEVNSELCGKHFPCIGNSKCKGTEAGRVTRQGSRKSKEANVNGTEPARERTEYKVRQRLQRGRESLCAWSNCQGFGFYSEEAGKGWRCGAEEVQESDYILKGQLAGCIGRWVETDSQVTLPQKRS